MNFLLGCGIGAAAVLTAAGCNNAAAGKTEIKDSTLLRMAIINSIKVPFLKTDTLILSPVRMDFQPGKGPVVNFSTKFEQPPYHDSLSKKLGLTVITEEEFVAQMISAPENGQLHCSFSAGILDTCMNHKITASIWAEKAAATGNIIVHETYLLGDNLQSFVKEFYTEANGNWNFKLNMTSVSKTQQNR